LGHLLRAGTFLIFLMATMQTIAFCWVRGVEKGMAEAQVGAAIRLPRVFNFILRWVTPTLLLVVIVLWLYYDVLGRGEQVSGYIQDLSKEGATTGVIAWPSLCSLPVAVLVLTAAAWHANKGRSQEVEP
jgi:hypothetical protein